MTKKRNNTGSGWFAKVMAAGGLLGVAALLGSPDVAQAQGGPSCSSPWRIDQTMTNGARWQMCWERRDREGVVLQDIYYTNTGGVVRKVLAEIAVAQIHVPYDDDRARYHDVSDYGLGSATHQNVLSQAECPGGSLLNDGTGNIVCRQLEVVSTAGLLGSAATVQSKLVVFSVSHVGAYNYIPQYTFFDDGRIEPAMGATGRLQRYRNEPEHGWAIDENASNSVGVSHLHNYYWRLDFDLGGYGNDDVLEEINLVSNASRTRRQVVTTAFTSEVARQVSPQDFRRWRVRDGNIYNGQGTRISYEIAAVETGHNDHGPSYEPWTFSDIYLTRARGCERFASHNPADAFGGCTSYGNVAEFVNGESVVGEDQVVWFGLSFHHIPRDEDEPYMHAHWNRFQITPRDWNNPATALAVAEPIVIKDGLENWSSWSVNPSFRDRADKGDWELGLPEQTVTARGRIMQPATVPEGDSALITGLLAGAGPGANDVDGGGTTVRSGFFDVPEGVSAKLEYQFFFAHSRAATSDDFFQVKIVSDSSRLLHRASGSARWRKAIWKEKSFDISQWMGKRIQLEIKAKDGANGNIVEAGFDDLRITVERE